MSADRVTLATRLWGDGYDHFIDGWVQAALAGGFTNIVAVVDRPRAFPESVVQHVVDVSDYEFAQSGYLARIDELVDTEWVWHLDIDDRMLSTALGLMDFDAEVDVWQVPIIRSRGGYVGAPGRVTADEYLGLRESCWHAGSPIRMALRRQVVQPDTAWDDWGLWRVLCRAGARIGYVDQPAYIYNNSPDGICADLHRDKSRWTAQVLEV